MTSRIRKLHSRLEQNRLDGLIISSAANISYLTKYQSRDSYFLVTRLENVYFTDSRYTEEAALALKGKATLQKVNGSVFKLIADACLSRGLKKIGFEERALPFAEHNKIKEYLRNEACLIPTHSLVEELRQIKDAMELETIKKGVKITGQALDFIRDFIEPGIKELEAVAELERFIRYKGASAASFDIIAGFGPDSSFPHHKSGLRKMKAGCPALIDMGVDYLGYKTDLTRTFFLGKITSLARKVYDIVLAAQEAAISRIKPAARIADIDAAARQYIAKKGFGGFFGHALGHGVGLEVHEDPHISGKEKSELKPGMVFTIEPAIYLPGKFGVRIEDMVVVTEKGCEVISGFIDK